MLPQWTRCWHLDHTNWTARRLTLKLHSLVEHIQRFAFINAFILCSSHGSRFHAPALISGLIFSLSLSLSLSSFWSLLMSSPSSSSSSSSSASSRLSSSADGDADEEDFRRRIIRSFDSRRCQGLLRTIRTGKTRLALLFFFVFFNPLCLIVAIYLLPDAATLLRSNVDETMRALFNSSIKFCLLLNRIDVAFK